MYGAIRLATETERPAVNAWPSDIRPAISSIAPLTTEHTRIASAAVRMVFMLF